MANAFLDLLPVAIGALLMAWNLVLLPTTGWILWTRHRFAWQPVTAFWQKARPWACCGHARICSVGDAASHAKVEALADAQRLERVRRLLPFCLVPLPAVIVIHTITAYHIVSDGDMEHLLHRSTLIFSVFLEAMVVIFYLRPDSLTKTALRVAFASELARGAYVAITVGGHGGDLPPHERDFHFIVSHCGRLWGALVLQDSCFILLAHVVVVPVTIAIDAVVHGGEITWAMGSEIVFAAIVCAASTSLEKATKAGIHSGLQAQNSKALEGAAHAMLSTICDAVVHLTASFQLTEACPSLGALLHRSPCAPMEESFCDLFLNADDAEAFRLFMKAPAGGAGESSLARSMHATLKDSNQNPVKVQLFHTSCLGIGTDDVHLVGIRDMGEECYTPTPPGLPANAKEMAAQNLHAGFPQGRSLATISEDTVWQTDSDAGDSDRSCAVYEEDSAKVWVGVDDSALTMLRWTPPFIDILGSSLVSEGSDLSGLAPSRKEQERLAKRMQFLSNSLLHDEAGAQAELRLVLESEHHGILRIEASAELELDDEDAGEDLPIVISVKHWHRVTAWHSRFSKSMRRQSSPSERSGRRRRSIRKPSGPTESTVRKDVVSL